jgi:hypothetical protein
MELRMAYRWAIAILLAAISAALMAGANFRIFLICLAGILLLGFVLREHDKAKRKRPDNE